MWQAIMAESAPTLWLPGGASTISGGVDTLFNVILWICIFFFLLVTIMLVAFTIMYRHKPGKTRDTAAGHSTTLELTWTLIPSIIVVFLYYYGFRHYMEMTIEPPNSYEITANGKMWQWSFIYSTGLEHTELHVPIGTPIRVVLQSNDVIHSLYIPAFRVKKDVVPGRFNRLWFEATDSSSSVYATSMMIDGKPTIIAADSIGNSVKETSEVTPKQTSENYAKLSAPVQAVLNGTGAKFAASDDVHELLLCNGSTILLVNSPSNGALIPINSSGAQMSSSPVEFGSLPSAVQSALKSEAHADIPAAQQVQVFLDAQPYDIYCAGYCGTNHSTMRSRVIVHRTQADFERWLKEQTEILNQLPPVKKGEKLSRTQGCVACHSLDGTRLVGPSWKDLWGKTETLTGGTKILVDKPYISESILQPLAKIVDGYPPQMPPFVLKDNDIEAIIAYMKSISANTSAADRAALDAPASQPASQPATQPAAGAPLASPVASPEKK